MVELRLGWTGGESSGRPMPGIAGLEKKLRGLHFVVDFVCEGRILDLVGGHVQPVTF